MKSEVTKYLAAIGSKGGKVTGPTKARTSAQARAAVNARWAKRKKNANAKPKQEVEKQAQVTEAAPADAEFAESLRRMGL
jgi:hypothetical protein